MKYAGLELVEDKSNFYFQDKSLDDAHDKRGMIKEKCDLFVATHGLKESHSSKYPTWINVLPLPVQRTMRVKYSNNYNLRDGFEIMKHSGLADHDKLFVKDGKYIYVTQPYFPSLEKYKQIESLFGQHGLFVDISYKDAWWSPGATPLIAIGQIKLELSK